MPKNAVPSKPRWQRGRYARLLVDGYELGIDGATAYRVRLLPSNKELGRFPTSSDAVRFVEGELLAGRHERTLALDWVNDAGRTGKIAAGHSLMHLAGSMIGQASHLIVIWGDRGAHKHEIAVVEMAERQDRRRSDIR